MRRQARLAGLALLAAAFACGPGASTPSTCGDGVVDPGEECDFGPANGPGKGCESDCSFSCTASSCAATDPCAGATSCAPVQVSGHAGRKCVQGAPLAEGAPCGDGKACAHGACAPVTIPAGCGDGKLDPGEDCDFGTAANLSGSGCEPNCKFSCSIGPDSCPQGDPCAGPDTCTAVHGAPGSGTGQKCQRGAALAACAACGGGSICVAGACSVPRCGDGCLDTAAGEQCDDGNLVNLDGCDSTCHLEVEQRATSLALQMPPSATDSTCAANAIGAAMVLSQTRTTVQGNIDSEIASGVATLGFAFLGLTDLTGAGAQTVRLGALYGTPAASRPGHAYSGASDEDWWYSTDSASIDASRHPLSALDGTLSGGALTATGSMRIKLSLGGAPTETSLSAVRLHAQVGPASAPLASDGGAPGQLAAGHVDPDLRVFGSLTGGKMCANVSAASLAAAAIPASMLSQGHCSEALDSNSTLLDLLVSGCTAYGVAQAIKPTQPDQSDPAAPAAGAGAPYTLSATSGTKVNRCTSNGAAVDLQTCLASAAYSVYFQLGSDRVIFK